MKIGRIVMDDLTGGRNGADAPTALAQNECRDAVNVDWYRTRFARKRDGSSALSLSGAGLSNTTISFLGRHVPGTDESAAMLFAVGEGVSTTTVAYNSGGAWSNPTVVNPPVLSAWEVTGVSFNGKYFMSYFSGIGRLNVYDPTTNKLRPTGLYTPIAATVANTGSGTYAATLRYYRVRFTVSSRYSEAGPSVSFTPSGSGTAARITRPGTWGEGESDWVIEASTDNVTFYVITTQLAATTTFDDSLLVGSYTGFAVSALTGTFTLQPAYRFIAADQNRIVGFGNWDPPSKQNRIEISAVLGSRDQGDDERVDTTSTYKYDLDESDSGKPTGLVGPVWGNYYAFKSRQMWELAPTGSVDNPYRLTAITKELGCIGGKGAVRGEDASGSPCIYFLSHRGVYRYGTGGLALISHGIEDLLLGPTATVNMAATKMIAHMVYYADRRQLWCWVATAASNDPNILLVLNVRTGGWSRFTGLIASARCSTMFANSVAATMGFQLVPYCGISSGTAIQKAVDTTATSDSGAAFQAYVDTRTVEPETGYNGAVGECILRGPAASGVTLTVVVTPDFATSGTQTGTALMTTGAGSEAWVNRPVGNTNLSDAEIFTYRVGDGSALSNGWSIDRLTIPIIRNEPITT